MYSVCIFCQAKHMIINNISLNEYYCSIHYVQLYWKLIKSEFNDLQIISKLHLTEYSTNTRYFMFQLKVHNKE